MIVILAVIVMAAAIYVKTHKPQTGSNVSTTTIVYQMEVHNQPEYMLDAIQVGDQIYDKERSTRRLSGYHHRHPRSATAPTRRS